MAQTPEQRRDAAKRSRLMLLYKITPEEESAVERFQRGIGTFAMLLEKSDCNAEARLYNDHNHVSGLYRGKLAYLINKGLGVIESTYKERTPAILRALAYYLDNPPATTVLGKPRYGMIGRAKMNKKKPVYGSQLGLIKEPKKARNHGK